MKQTNKRSYLNYENDTSVNSILWIIVIVILLLYMLFSGVTTLFKQYKNKIIDGIEEICPKCDGIIKFIGGTDYEIKLNVDVENEIVKVKIGNGKDLDFEKIVDGEDDVFYELVDKANRNSGLSYMYDKNTGEFIYNGKRYNKEEFISKINESQKFNYDFSKEIEEVEEKDNLDICFEDLIIDLGNKKVTRTYNIKLKNYIYIISFEDYMNVIDSSITPVAYYEEDLLSEHKIKIYGSSNGNVNLKEVLLDKIKYLDLDNTLKIPNFEIIELDGYDLINEEYEFNWFNENLTIDYSCTLKVIYHDLLGNEYVEMVGLVFSDSYTPVYKGLLPSYDFKVGEYITPIPTQVYTIVNGEKIDVSGDVVIDDGNVNENEVGSYEIYYKYKSKYSNITHIRKVIINIVE